MNNVFTVFKYTTYLELLHYAGQFTFTLKQRKIQKKKKNQLCNTSYNIDNNVQTVHPNITNENWTSRIRMCIFTGIKMSIFS